MGQESLNSPLGCIQLTYIKSIDMLNKKTPGVKKRGQVRSTSQLLFIHSTKKCDILVEDKAQAVC